MLIRMFMLSTDQKAKYEWKSAVPIGSPEAF